MYLPVKKRWRLGYAAPILCGIVSLLFAVLGASNALTLDLQIFYITFVVVGEVAKLIANHLLWQRAFIILCVPCYTLGVILTGAGLYQHLVVQIELEAKPLREEALSKETKRLQATKELKEWESALAGINTELKKLAGMHNPGVRDLQTINHLKDCLTLSKVSDCPSDPNDRPTRNKLLNDLDLEREKALANIKVSAETKYWEGVLSAHVSKRPNWTEEQLIVPNTVNTDKINSTDWISGALQIGTPALRALLAVIALELLANAGFAWAYHLDKKQSVVPRVLYSGTVSKPIQAQNGTSVSNTPVPRALQFEISLRKVWELNKDDHGWCDVSLRKLCNIVGIQGHTTVKRYMDNLEIAGKLKIERLGQRTRIKFIDSTGKVGLSIVK